MFRPPYCVSAQYLRGVTCFDSWQLLVNSSKSHCKNKQKFISEWLNLPLNLPSVLVSKGKVKVSLFNFGSSVSSQNCYQWKSTVRPLPPPSVSAPFYGYLKLQLHRSEKRWNKPWSHRESNWGSPAQKAAHLPTVLHACSVSELTWLECCSGFSVFHCMLVTGMQSVTTTVE